MSRYQQQECNLENYHQIAKHWNAACFAESIACSDVIWLCHAESTVIGHLIIRGCLDCWDIIDFFVVADQRRQGVGTQLINSAQQELESRESASLFLEVSEHNTAARSLYERCQFTVVGYRKNYYRHDNSNALRLYWHPQHPENDGNDL